MTGADDIKVTLCLPGCLVLLNYLGRQYLGSLGSTTQINLSPCLKAYIYIL